MCCNQLYTVRASNLHSLDMELSLHCHSVHPNLSLKHSEFLCVLILLASSFHHTVFNQVCIFLILRASGLDEYSRRGLTSVEQRQAITSLCWPPFLMQPNVRLPMWTASVHCCLFSSFSSSRTHRSSCTMRLLSVSSPGPYICLGLP